MTLDKRSRAKLCAHCEAFGEDDGVDPRTFFQSDRTAHRDNRKARQLCRQVADTLDQVLSGETADDLVRSLHEAAVVSAPDSSRLLVTLRSDLPPEQFDREELQRRVSAHHGRLRCAVAAAITRRKAPNLDFQVLGLNQSHNDAQEVQP
jgi:ribosome-binding factor A